MAQDERVNIFNRVRSGELSVEEADRLLQDLDDQNRPNTASEFAQRIAEEERDETPEEIVSGLGWWRNAWMIPLWVGIGIMVLSALLINWAYMQERFFWFYCSWLPLTLGILILLLGVWSRQARWIHLRIKDADGPKISFSLPLPIRLASWFLRVFGARISGLRGKNLEQLPAILDAMGDNRDPISVEVDDEKDGDRVRIYIL